MSAASSTIRLVTTIPGPKSKEWMARRESAVPRGISGTVPVFAARAEGAIIEDIDGNRLLDFAGGIGCLNAGHRAPGVVAALAAQLERYLHTCFMVTPYEGYVRLAEVLNERTPGDFAKKTFFLNSGAEAVENAIKIARCFTGRQAVIAFEDGFHGRTQLALSLTSKTTPYKAGFGPFAPEVYRMPYAYCYRCPYNLAQPSCNTACAAKLEDVFLRHVEAKAVAAIIVEPVLGEGGFVVPPPEFLPGICEIARRHGILVIADEVQTGFGRTGALFACERFGIVPDLIVTAKSIGAGMPIAAVTGRAEIMDAPVAGGLGGTFGGHPLSCAAALAAFDFFDKQDLTSRANRVGQIFLDATRNWIDRFPLAGDIRSLGGMCAVELVEDRATRKPAKTATQELLSFCHQRGLVVISAGTYGNVVRMLVPLVATDEQVEEGLRIIEEGLVSLHARATNA
jgi:4-aminobutyrate aminotransferase/(S)-3-amino-2-methylpropionate transaminase